MSLLDSARVETTSAVVAPRICLILVLSQPYAKDPPSNGSGQGPFHENSRDWKTGTPRPAVLEMGNPWV